MERVDCAVAIDIREAVLSSAWQKLDDLSDEQMAADNFPFFRVPAHIRERNKLLFEPRMVAIGPYGRSDKPSLRAMEWLNPSLGEMEWVKPSLRAMEQLKRRYLQSFCSRSIIDRFIDDYKAKIRELEPWARRCYFEPVELSTEKFVEMLLLDGCFILEFLIKWNEKDKDGMLAAECSLPLIRGDLLLLENQIPLFVLDKLSEHVMLTVNGKIVSLMELLENYLTAMNVESPEEERKISKEGMIPSLMKLLVKYLTCMNVERPKESSKEWTQANHGPGVNVPRKAKDFHHLLHLYYDCYVMKQQTNPMRNTICRTILKWLRPSRIFTLLLSKICGSNNKRSPRTIPSATELLEAGVSIKKKKKNQNRRSSFLDVAFDDGVLEIPFLSVENSTLPRFSNLVAFEQCGGRRPEVAYMTSYAVFMDCLINTREDVAILRKLGILENKLGSDKELAVFFNQLSDWAAVDYERHYLAILFRKVGEYCGSPWPSWRAKLVREYFSSPWAILSLLAAAVLLILTILQTVYTIYPYYHPGN